MIHKRSKFWTFLFSMLPGAGHMYMGLMKQGTGLMALFFGITFIGSWLDIGPAVLISWLIWFFAFFDCLNKRSLPDEEFYQLEDKFLFGIFDETADRMTGQKVRFGVAAAMVFVGIMVLWQNFWDFVCAIFPHIWMEWIGEISYRLPRLVFAVVILYIGIRLIIGKKRDLERIEWNEEEK